MKLHIYGQSIWHDHAFIVGNTEALTALRDALDAALQPGAAVGEVSMFTSDGEGYELKVYREEDGRYWDKSLLPYTDSTMYTPALKDIISPWDLLRKYKR
jgi:hypothetical protein